MDGHLPTLGWSPTNLRMFTISPRMVSHQKEMYYKLQIWHINITYCHAGWSPTNPRMVTHQKEMYYKLQIWHLNITYKTTTRLQLPCIVTYHP